MIGARTHRSALVAFGARESDGPLRATKKIVGPDKDGMEFRKQLIRSVILSMITAVWGNLFRICK